MENCNKIMVSNSDSNSKLPNKKKYCTAICYNRKPSRLSKKFPDYSETSQTIQTLPDYPETFQSIWNLSRLYGKFPDHLETFQIIEKLPRPS